MFLIKMLIKINWFFQKFFQSKNKSLLKHCVRCNEFLTTKKHKSVYNFIKHYEDGLTIPFEDKPLEIIRFPGLTIYSTEVQKHRDFYDLFNSEKYVDGFLRNVRYKFKPGGKKWMKCSFTIENTRNSPYQHLRPIINSRYWTTLLYKGTYFNDFIFHSLKQNILGRVIINGMSGSSWHFKRFVSLSLKILDNNVEVVI